MQRMWHSKFRKLLSESYQEIKSRNKNYSLRAFAKKIGVSPGTISELIKGSRKVSLERALKILKLLDTESSNAEIQRLIQMKTQPKARVRTLLRESEDIISNWEYFAIHSLLSCDDPPRSPKEVAERLSLSEDQIPTFLRTMEKHGLLESDGSGFYVPREEALSTTDGIPSRAILNSHYGALELAKARLEVLTLEKRDFISLTFPADPDSLELARKEVRRFKDRIQKIMQGKNTTSVFRLQVQLFDLDPRKK